MADAIVKVDPDSTGKAIDMSELTVSGQTVERQRIVLADDSAALALAKILNSAPVGTEFALAVRNIPSGTQPVSGPLTDAQLRTAPVPVSGTFFQGTQPVSAAALPLPTGAATEATLDARTGSLTEAAPASDTASSGLNGRLQRIAQRLTSLLALLPASLGQKTMANGLAVTVASDQSALPVSGPVTDAQLRASAVPVSNATLPLPSGASTEATLALIKAKTDNLDVALSTRTKPADTQPVSAASLPLPAGAAMDATLGTVGPAPGAFTVLDRLAQVTVRLDALNKVALAALQARPAAKVASSTLLHRS